MKPDTIFSSVWNYPGQIKKNISQRNFKNPSSVIAFFLIALAYIVIHFMGHATNPSWWIFFLYLLVFLAGIWLTRITLLLWFPDLTVAITLITLAFGTNLFCMVSLDYQPQPILLFSMYALVVFLTASWHENQKQIYAYSLGISLGLITLFQATGFLALLIPVLWGVHDRASWKEKITKVWNQAEQFWHFLACLAIVVLMPLLIYDIGPGEIKTFSFHLPGIFYAFSSFLWNDLFSFDHGWFIYTPVMVFAFIGFYFFSEKNRPVFYAVFLFCILDLFLQTSWSFLGTTPVFGQVAFIPAYALLVLPMASFMGLIQTGKPVSRVVLVAVTAIFILMNVSQSWQYSHGIIVLPAMIPNNHEQIPDRPVMTETEKSQMNETETKGVLVLTDETKFRKVNLAFYDFEDTNVPYKSKLESNQVKSGKMALTMDSTTRFSPVWKIRYDDFKKSSGVGMRITASVFAASPLSISGVNLVISSTHEGINYRYKRLNLGEQKLSPGVWNTVSFDYVIPDAPGPEDNLVSYVWYTGKEMIYIDDLKYEAFEPKK